MKEIIPVSPSIIVSADAADFNSFERLLKGIKGVRNIGAIKIGSILCWMGLDEVVCNIRSVMGKEFPIIFDHQKAGTDIPDMGKPFAKGLAWYGVNAVILFPFAGPNVQECWTKACFGEGLQVLTGGLMTHGDFLASEGGYIADGTPERIYRHACSLGVRHFVVPGTKIDRVRQIRTWIECELEGEAFSMYAPGFGSQGGDFREFAQATQGLRWHPIVGRAIADQRSIRGVRDTARRFAKEVRLYKQRSEDSLT